jgi:hypothetical protein
VSGDVSYFHRQRPQPSSQVLFQLPCATASPTTISAAAAAAVGQLTAILTPPPLPLRLFVCSCTMPLLTIQRHPAGLSVRYGWSVQTSTDAVRPLSQINVDVDRPSKSVSSGGYALSSSGGGNSSWSTIQVPHPADV